MDNTQKTSDDFSGYFGGAEVIDVEAWDALITNLREVQSVLDHNNRLIQQADENHRSKIPQNLAKNVGLISQINANIKKAMALYSDISANLSSTVQERRDEADKVDREES